jgi:hypothetical protein
VQFFGQISSDPMESTTYALAMVSYRSKKLAMAWFLVFTGRCMRATGLTHGSELNPVTCKLTTVTLKCVHRIVVPIGICLWVHSSDFACAVDRRPE